MRNKSRRNDKGNVSRAAGIATLDDEEYIERKKINLFTFS